MQHPIDSLELLEQQAKKIAGILKPGDVVYLLGDLGAGKTTFTQMLLKACGVREHIKSPTYTLYETYQIGDMSFVHMDLYRLSDPEELFFLGIEDLLDDRRIVVIEWPEKGRGVLPQADWVLEFNLNKLNRTLTITSE